MSSRTTNGSDITKTCTGKIKKDDLMVRSWEDPPLHVYCSKRLWESTVKGILDSKKEQKGARHHPGEESAKP